MDFMDKNYLEEIDFPKNNTLLDCSLEIPLDNVKPNFEIDNI